MNAPSPILEWPIIGEIGHVFGFIEKNLYYFLSSFSANNIVFLMLLMTIVVNLCLLPIRISQRKTIRLSVLAGKDMEKIEKKYDYTDTKASRYREFADKKKIQKKYGIKRTNVLTLVINLCVISGLYASIYSLQYFIPSLKPDEFFSFFGMDLSKSNGWSFDATLLFPVSFFIIQYLSSVFNSIAYRYKKLELLNIGSIASSAFMLIFAFSFPLYLCLYWMFNDIVAFIFDLLLDALYYKRKNPEYFIEKNLKKMNEKRKKRGQYLLEDDFEIIDIIKNKEKPQEVA